MTVRYDDPFSDDRFAADDPALPEHFQVYSIDKNKLGVGPISFCYRAQRSDSPLPVRLKVLRSRICDLPEIRELTGRLAEALPTYKGENILRFQGLGTHGSIIYFQYEYIDGLSLRELIDEYSPFHPDLAMIITAEIIAGLNQIHGARPSPGMGNLIPLHRNLKPENILISREGMVKLADLNMVDITYLSARNKLDLPFDPRSFEAPEQLLRDGYADRRSDFFALGMIILEMVTGSLPYLGKDVYSTRQEIREDLLVPPKRLMPPVKERERRALLKRVVALAEQLITHDPNKRLQRLADLESALSGYFRQTAYDDRADSISQFLTSRFFNVKRSRRRGFIDRLFGR